MVGISYTNNSTTTTALIVTSLALNLEYVLIGTSCSVPANGPGTSASQWVSICYPVDITASTDDIQLYGQSNTVTTVNNGDLYAMKIA